MRMLQKELEASAKFIYTFLKEVSQLSDKFKFGSLLRCFDVEKSNPSFLRQKFKSVDGLETSHLHPFLQH